jgi:hypothetical protein
MSSIKNTRNSEIRGKCQIMDLGAISHKLLFYEVVWQRIKKLSCTFRRRWNYFKKWIEEMRGKRECYPDGSKQSRASLALKAGDLVRVKSEEEIRKTLNRWNQRQGCGMMEEMWLYCGTTQRVLKRVERFLDERDYLIKKCKGIVLLENLSCQGTKDFGRCDRSCHFFWREEWLEEVRPTD